MDSLASLGIEELKRLILAGRDEMLALVVEGERGE